ncbi:signal transduction histidine kinase containing a receiver domain (hybrid) and a PAS sensor domain (plasmid) [Cupriavidus necator N-1]|uniref:histidine kinase n=1 Tax=Cupriavidus necator (strain ATCC 43291 / DSM 13513 / CCUG 52238 / LMG 8453 / N-1) TaxID=1042878 RepID=F8GU65_CUPNN|nr:PAS domain-containing hybrid sensor histidine kinase/response regulator [Cupriavidus necator]AEI82269.1 signal transduction histidine kinase containing a receiver domain (hybrid) and a PAS sensor domain [Cupriavidus necator N-1]MDX6007289.1 ATP-binding protein [Cupriavidus necator]
MRSPRKHPSAKFSPSKPDFVAGERYFRQFAGALPHIVWTAKPDGWVDYVNQRGVTYTGLALDQISGWGWGQGVHPDDLQATIDRWKVAINSGSEFEIEFRMKRAADGAYRWFLCRALPFKDVNGNIIKWFGTATDVEDQKQAQAAAERANRAKSDFLSSMSHELRSPLNAILGFAQLMASDSLPPTPSQQASIDQILKAGWHLLELINEVLDLAKIEAGQASLSPEPVSLSDALRECHCMIEQQALKRGIRMRFPLLDSPCFVRADRTRLKQILVNLLSNAIKYNRDQGTVEVSVTTGERVRISVRDTGAGLAPERLAQLFQPFNRLGQEAGPEEGSGIGLVVTKRLVELMGGTIGAESTVGAGSVFWVELGAASAPEMTDESAGPGVSAYAQLENRSSPHTLLYVEDNPANLKLVEQLIARRTDMHLLTAGTGALGVELARTSLPEVIMMDIHLPDINGVEALRMLQEDRRTAHIPVIALSANAMPRDIEKGIKAGFFLYLTKPIKLNEFMEALNTALERTKHETGQEQ